MIPIRDRVFSSIVVGVGFDTETQALVDAAISLAERTDAQLRFVSVVETQIADAWVSGLPLYSLSPSVAADAHERARREKEEAMRHLVATIPPRIKATWAVLSGEVVGTLIEEAQACQARCIFAAYNFDQYATTMPNGFSLALRLMAESPLPVLVSNHAHPVDFSKEGFTMLVGDDLQAGSQEAVRTTFELASSLGRCRVRQVHIHGDFRDSLHRRWLNFKEQYPLLQLDGKSPQAALDEEDEDRLAALRRRGDAWRDAASLVGTTTEINVRFGSLAPNLEAEINDLDPDLLVYGRHKILKAKPYLLGRVGFRTMIAARRPVLVVPPPARALVRPYRESVAWLPSWANPSQL